MQKRLGTHILKKIAGESYQVYIPPLIASQTSHRAWGVIWIVGKIAYFLK